MQNGTMFDDSHVIKKNYNRKAIAKISVQAFHSLMTCFNRVNDDIFVKFSGRSSGVGNFWA